VPDVESTGPDSFSQEFGADGPLQPDGSLAADHFEFGPDLGGEATPVSSRIKFIPLSHRVPDRLGFMNCPHPDGHDYLVAVEVEHAAGGPDLADTLAFVVDRLFDHLRIPARNSYAVAPLPGLDRTGRYDPDPSEASDHPFGSRWHGNDSWIADETRRFVEERIPPPLRGAVTAWSVRIYPADSGPKDDGSASVHRSPRPRFDSEEGFPYGIPGYTQALEELEQYRKGRACHAQDRTKELRRLAAMVRKDVDRWTPPGAPALWVDALRVAETGLGQYAADVSESLRLPSWMIGSLATALYVVSAESGTAPEAVRRDQIPAEVTRSWHDCSDTAARLTALGHDLTDETDPVSACWQVLAYDYCEPDAREDPIAAQIYDEDSTALSGTRFNLAMADIMRFWNRLWPGDTITPWSRCL